jgi:hypothetical protein
LNLRPLGYEGSLACSTLSGNGPNAAAVLTVAVCVPGGRRRPSTRCDGSMIGRPRQGDMLARSASTERTRKGPPRRAQTFSGQLLKRT